MGGMGEVYLGRHIAVGRNVAVKILRSVFTGDEHIVKRFYREAQAAAAVKHKNIVDILDVGVSDLDDPYIVMEYLEGESLGDLLKRVGPIDLCAACAVMEPALEALQAAHDAGVVHRDLKPDNIFIVRAKKGPPEIKLIDFGISKFTTADKETRLTADGSLLGTPSYMSPEQSRGLRDIDGRADVYAMGVIMYEMLSGELPFDGDNYNAILIASLTEPPKPPTKAYAGFPFAAESIVMKALEKKRTRRFKSAIEMLDALRGLEDFEGRAQSLQLVMRDMKNPGIAIGDLGYDTTTLDIEGPIAAEVLSDVLKETRTPKAWTDAGEPDEKAPERRSRPGVLRAMLLALAVMGVGALGGLWATGFFEADARTDPPVTVETPRADPSTKVVEAEAEAEAETGVLIEVVGAPTGAKIYYRDVMIPMNPFRVDRRETIATLRVEAGGCKPFVVAVLPTEDRRVEVAMKKTLRPGPGVPNEIPGGAGSLTRAQADRVYNAKKGQLVECYNRSLKDDEAPSDRSVNARMTIRIKRSGMVKGVSLNGTSAYPLLDDCIRISVKTWIFPATGAGGTETFKINFTPR